MKTLWLPNIQLVNSLVCRNFYIISDINIFEFNDSSGSNIDNIIYQCLKKDETNRTTS